MAPWKVHPAGLEQVPGIGPLFHFFEEFTAGFSQADLRDLIGVLFYGIAFDGKKPHPFHVKEVIMDVVEGESCPVREGPWCCRTRKLPGKKPDDPFFVVPYEIGWCLHPVSLSARPVLVFAEIYAG